MVNDPIADLLIRIMNAQKVGHSSVKIPFSRIKFDLVKILEQEGFIDKSKVIGDKPKESIIVSLKYNQNIPAINNLKRISKPGQRIYAGAGEIKLVKGGYGITIISTSYGLMSNKEAKKRKIGGELLCEVW